MKRLIPQQLKKELLLNKKKLLTMSMLMFLIKVLKIICCKKIQVIPFELEVFFHSGYISIGDLNASVITFQKGYGRYLHSFDPDT